MCFKKYGGGGGASMLKVGSRCKSPSCICCIFYYHPLRPLYRETTSSISFYCFFRKFPIEAWRLKFTLEGSTCGLGLRSRLALLTWRLKFMLEGSTCGAGLPSRLALLTCGRDLRYRLAASRFELRFPDASYELQARV